MHGADGYESMQIGGGLGQFDPRLFDPLIMQ